MTFAELKPFLFFDEKSQCYKPKSGFEIYFQTESFVHEIEAVNECKTFEDNGEVFIVKNPQDFPDDSFKNETNWVTDCGEELLSGYDWGDEIPEGLEAVVIKLTRERVFKLIRERVS